jgi:CRP-like cAMP-binding protein
MNAMSRIRAYADEVVIRQGDVGDKFFVLEDGACKIIVNGAKVGDISAGSAFGELALMYNCPRAASIVATEACVLWSLDRTTFRNLIATTSSASMAERCEFLRNVKLLASLSNNELAKLAGAMVTQTFQRGEAIIRQGDAGESFYVIKEGAVVATESSPSAESKAGVDTVEIGSLQKGDFFGEMALMHDEPRMATITAVAATEVLVLGRREFTALLGPLSEILNQTEQDRRRAEKAALSTARGASGRVAPTAMAASAARAVTDDGYVGGRTCREQDLTIRFEDLEQICVLGEGTFGRVKLVQHRATRRVMALKAMQKAQVVASHQQLNVVSEKDVMLAADHPFVLKLYRTFSDRDQIYMLLELVQGGELWSLLYQNAPGLPRCSWGGFEVHTAMFYAGCVTAAFEHVHGMGVAYRDLKPENLLIDSEGYLKMVDFGFAKKIPFVKKGVRQERSFTVCGTPEYLSPEIVTAQGHTKAVDYWALGILIYELLIGGTPFADPLQSKIFDKIVHSEKHLHFPRDFDLNAENLIKSLLQPNAAMRMGTLKGGIDDITGHAWFAGARFDWQGLVAKRLRAPYVPKIKNPLDTSNFDRYPEKVAIAPYKDDGQDWFATF